MLKVSAKSSLDKMSLTQSLSLYADFILKNAPRVITQIDKDSDSSTYGSCDRSHWHLKIRDFDSAILQQTGLALTMLYQIAFPDNIYYGKENIKKWAIASAQYWAKIQLRDGSYNEYYPNEHGFPPTAFTLYTVSEVYLRLQLDDAFIKNKIAKTAKYLCSNVETKAFNQEMASITGLYNAYRVLGEQWVLDGCEKKLKRILSLQSPEGWFQEYGGADLGYLSVFLDMLCEYYASSKDERVVQPIGKIIDFVKYFIHPNATVGGEYASRNTTYFLPSGLEIALQLGFNDAAAIKQKLYAATNSYAYFMDSVDDRYFSHYLLHSFLRALEHEQKNDAVTMIPALPYENAETRYFEHSGLIVYNNACYAAIVGLRKGGVIIVFNKKRCIFIDCGYRVSFGNAAAATTNWQDPSYECSFSGNIAKVQGKMNKVHLKSSTPLLLAGLRLAAFFFGKKIINYLKSKLIFVDKHVDITFRRTIIFEREIITIKDYLSSANPVLYETADNMSLRHVASGKFFSLTDLLANRRELKYGTELEIERILNVETENMTECVN